MCLILIATIAFPASAIAQELPPQDAIRVREFYRWAAQIQDKIWPQWSQIPAPLLLVTDKSEFLAHHPAPPTDFKKISDEFYVRPRQYSTNLLATFPAFGPPSVIVIGEPENTSSKTSTPWLITLMHEHFHQLQNAQPGYFQAVEGLGLSHGDKTGMWMLNYPFPYDKPEVTQAFIGVRDLLVDALNESDEHKFAKLAAKYVTQRKTFFAQLSQDDHKYLAFQLWQEGIARYTQIKVAESAAQYQPSPEYAALPDFESFGAHAFHARKDTLDELRKSDLSKSKREVVYAWGAAEGLLLDRRRPEWRDEYFSHPFRWIRTSRSDRCSRWSHQHGEGQGFVSRIWVTILASSKSSSSIAELAANHSIRSILEKPGHDVGTLRRIAEATAVDTSSVSDRRTEF